MEITVLKREYILTEEYTDDKGNTEVAKVKLSVNESNGTFEVTPGDGMDAFYYKSRTKGDFGMWAAVSKLTYMAVEFGIKQCNPKEVAE
jgi:hypothetical protein